MGIASLGWCPLVQGFSSPINSAMFFGLLDSIHEGAQLLPLGYAIAYISASNKSSPSGIEICQSISEDDFDRKNSYVRRYEPALVSHLVQNYLWYDLISVRLGTSNVLFA